MSKIFFVMNDRNDKLKGYTEVSQEYIKNYIKSFPEGERAYFINLGYAYIETDKENYKQYYSDLEHQNYVKKLEKKANVFSYNTLDTDEMNGVDIAVDQSEPFEDTVLRKLMIEQLPEAMAVLTYEEKELIYKIYYENMSYRMLAELYDVSHTTIKNRRKIILVKIKKNFE